ncbi:MAG: SsrA-binding protein SmpB [Candidatus Bipolaricaulia bacterium]
MDGIKIVATNRKARHDYEIEETYEAGLVLKGTEVKSLRRGSCSLKDGFALVKEGEVFLYNVYIAPYEEGSHYNPDPERPRKLLLHKQEIVRLTTKVRERGYTLVPLKIYFKDGYAKVELALAKGRAKYDKREKIKRKEQEREMRRALKELRRG